MSDIDSCLFPCDSLCSGHLWTAKWWTENNTPGGMELQSMRPFIAGFELCSFFQVPLVIGRMMALARRPPTWCMNGMHVGISGDDQ